MVCLVRHHKWSSATRDTEGQQFFTCLRCGKVSFPEDDRQGAPRLGPPGDPRGGGGDGGYGGYEGGMGF